ncbi:KN motif and ankyrin repeat domain-containing protein 4 [Latimeria chalumnae]|uniref:KN motif and ankyrin repeat domain-containing protein 4 n=1 Tax=Latimeria chalumnae TaxID=7897 RepID=UPI00313EC4E3
MDKTTGNGDSSKTSENGNQQKQLPYSLETPYGFHLDLDFLKYVDDIEKGNTIKRVHIHRKAKQPKYSTLPRNFSIPNNGSRSYESSFSSGNWTSSYLPAPKNKVVKTKDVLDFAAADSTTLAGSSNTCELNFKVGSTYQEIKGEGKEACYGEPSALSRGRPQLLRASSMPVTVLQRKDSEEQCSTPTDVQHSNRTSCVDNIFNPANESISQNSSKNFVLTKSEEGTNIKEFQIALQRIKELEEKVKSIPNLKKQILLLKEEKNVLITQLQNQSFATEFKDAQSLTLHKGSRELDNSVNEGVYATNGYKVAKNQNIPSLDVTIPETSMHTKQNTNVMSSKHLELNISENEMESSVRAEVGSTAVTNTENELCLESSTLTEPFTVITLKAKITVLENQLNDARKELEKNSDTHKQQNEEHKAKNINPHQLPGQKIRMDSKPAVQEEKCILVDKKASDNHKCSDAAVNTEIVQEGMQKETCDKGITVDIHLSTQSVGCGDCTVDIFSPVKEVHSMGVQTDCDDTTTDSSMSSGADRCDDKAKEAVIVVTDKAVDIDQTLLLKSSIHKLSSSKETTVVTQDPISKSNVQSLINDNDSESITFAQTEGSRLVLEESGQSEQSECDSMNVNTKAFQDDLGNKEQVKDETQQYPAIVGQYVNKIQVLLQEQWACLEHGYPELANALKQPASKISSIQNQLMSSLNVLSSVYSTQTSSEEKNVGKSSPELVRSPTTMLKSIMKKKNCNPEDNGTKKNLQFVGINGGYETTSSEDSSGEESSSDDNSGCDSVEKCDSSVENHLQAASNGSEAVSKTIQGKRVPDTEPNELDVNATDGPQQKTERVQIGEDFLAACLLLSHHLSEIRTTTDRQLKQSLTAVCQEWFAVSSQKLSVPEPVEDYLKEFKSISLELLMLIMNIADGNGNTALHYSVSHSNFQIVKLLLDTGVCDVDCQNKAGYTAVMLAPLAATETDEDMEVVLQLLKQGNVNIQTSQGGQTALMLSVSHGRFHMVKALLSCGADLNLQDDTGSTALMCACEQGNVEIVKLLLTQPSCCVELTDKVGRNAFSIALEVSHKGIAELLNAHVSHC